MGLKNLSNDSLVSCLDYLPIRDLNACLRVNSTLNRICINGMQWRKFAHAMLHGEADVEGSGYELCRDIVATRQTAQSVLITEGLVASTTDDINQTVHQTINDKCTSFWSSCGEGTEDGEDSVCYLLAGEGSLVSEISLVFYQADYQRDAPIYYSKSLQVMVGYPTDEHRFSETIKTIRSGKPTTTDQSAFIEDGFCWTYTSDHFPVERTEGRQVFKLPELAVGSVVRCILHGKTTRQAHDDLYYVCLQRFCCSGKLTQELPDCLRRATESIISKQADGVEVLKKTLCTSEGADLMTTNVPIGYSDRGTDTDAEYANRKLNLLTDVAVKRYGPDLAVPQTASVQEVAEHAIILTQLRSLFLLCQKYQALGS